jgi:hypothetical protein
VSFRDAKRGNGCAISVKSQGLSPWIAVSRKCSDAGHLEELQIPVILSVAPQARSRRTMVKTCLTMTTTVAGFYAMPD